MIGILDCNNFFVSCERLFRPNLNNKPVVVLSNNDGCVVSRSNEAKALGIPMGLPSFKLKDIVDLDNITIISGNHILYQDISARVMDLMSKEVEHLQIYSVDECFFALPYTDPTQIKPFITNLAFKIRKYIGIPVSIGVAPTRTLAKIASHISKKDFSKDSNTFIINQQESYDEYLRETNISDVWGIGRRNTEKLRQFGVKTAYDFVQMPSSWIRSHFSINEFHTQCELIGEDCTVINAITEAHKSIMTSRSFGTLISDKASLWEAIANYTANCAERLRNQQSSAKKITVFLRGDRHVGTIPFYSNSCDILLPVISYDTAYLIKNALIAFNHIYREGFLYRKAGVLLSQIIKNTDIQLNIFDKVDFAKQRRLMTAIDSINTNCGKDALKLGAQGLGGSHFSRKNYSSSQLNQPLHIFSGMGNTSLSQKLKKDIESLSD